MGSKNKTRTRLKIIGAAATAVFSSAAVFSGTYAWFASNAQVTASGISFSVATPDIYELNSIKLIKFDYSSTTYGSFTSTDWLTPETGQVNSYDYDYDSHSFNIDAMNPYDPVDRVVRGTSLKDLNCNAVYEVTITGPNSRTVYFELTSSVFDVIKEHKEDVLLSDYVDIDIFYEDDLDDDNELFIATDNAETPLVNEYNSLLYYPSYKISPLNKFYTWNGLSWDKTDSAPEGAEYTDKGTVIYEQYLPDSSIAVVNDYYKVLNETIDLGDNPSEIENAKIYYKISHLSSLIGENYHSHFYGDPKANRITLVENKQVTFSGSPIKFYINVNYAPSNADKCRRDIYLRDIEAIYDYNFEFEFLGDPRS